MFLGAYHSVEYPYIFGYFPIGNFNFTSDDYSYGNTLVNAIISFIKNLYAIN